VRISAMAGWCLIIFGVINLLHEISLRASGMRQPGTAYALATAVFFTAGAALLWRKKIQAALAKTRKSKIQ
jgi:hypothetical protein